MEIVASCPGRLDLSEVGRWAARVENLGFDTIHVPETIHDPFTVAALVIAQTRRVVVRTSMVVAFSRSPMVVALAAWDLQKFSGGRFQLGIASQVRGNIVGRYSAEWSEPVARMRDYVASLRAIFRSFQTGAELDHTGPHYRFTRLQPYFNPGPLEVGPPPLWTGGVNARMCALAGEVADGFVCHPTTSHPDALRAFVLPALADGRARSGRVDAGPRIVAGPQPITAVDESTLGEVRDRRRSEVAFLYSTPAYRPQLELFGLGALGERLSKMARSSDWSDMTEVMTDEVLGRLVPAATHERLPEVLDTWYAGLCHGLVLAVPENDAQDVSLRALVARCRAIVAAPGPSARGSGD